MTKSKSASFLIHYGRHISHLSLLDSITSYLTHSNSIIGMLSSHGKVER